MPFSALETLQFREHRSEFVGSPGCTASLSLSEPGLTAKMVPEAPWGRRGHWWGAHPFTELGLQGRKGEVLSVPWMGPTWSPHSQLSKTWLEMGVQVREERSGGNGISRTRGNAVDSEASRRSSPFRRRTEARTDNQVWYLRTAKLALALAIIRSKPADRSSREYTEHLARVVSGQESEWRSRVETLEAEVLQLRQKLLLSRICSGSFQSGDSPSQLQAQEPGSSENTLTGLEDSGCDLSNEQRTEPSEVSQDFCATSKNPLSSHVQFLQHLLQLKNWTESGSLKTDLSHLESTSSTVSDSVFQLLEGLITFYRDPKFPLSSFWTEAVATLARLLSDCSLSSHILKTCSKKLEEFEKTLLHIILRSNHINRFQVQHCVSKSLVTLGSCSLLRKSIISLLLSEVNSFIDDLDTINQVQASYDASRYENTFSLFWVLEQLLQKENEEGSTLSLGHDDQEIKKFLQKHDDAVLQLSDTFPLFTFYLWRLGILLNSTEKKTVENNSLP
ncbi:PREDICTED: meiosis-specific protein MEI4-like [Myotis davidii]|uniref:meiosis-specific protein MEI4-like n=1 Tax=Myotis davidii TaxID=225400 RepID=UPI0003EC29AE|nr:PREDICTED: meiosis-specific protein MEI4-like [Myotis davidii]